MNELANIYRGKSFSIGFTIPDEYDESRIEDLKVNIGTKVYQHTIVQGVIGVNLTSNDTAKMVGRQDVVLTIEDSLFGVQKLNCGYVYVSSTISKFQSESFSDVYDVMVMLSFYSERLSVDHVLFDYLKGKSAYEYAVEGGYLGTEEQFYLDLAKAAIAIPYTGADKDVDLGANGITVDNVIFNENPVSTIAPLKLQYNPAEKTIEFGLKDGGILQLGKEMFEEYTNIDTVALTNGMIVSTAAISGNRKGIKRTDFTSLTSIRSIVGMVTVASIGTNQSGRVTTNGIINELNTNGIGEGSQLWGNPSVLGGWSGNKPAKPQYAVQIGQVVVASATVGSVELNVAKDVKFSDLADVNGSTNLIDNTDTIPKRDDDGIIREITIANVKADFKADTDALYEPLLGFTPENTANKGQANGYASLGADGLVPSNQLPSFVDDVLEFANLASFPATGETGKIYVALDTNKPYRWSGSTYIYITSGAVDSVAGKTGVVTLVKADVGLGNVDNTSDAAKPISTATQTALNGKVNTTDIEQVRSQATNKVASSKLLDDELIALGNAVDAGLLLKENKQLIADYTHNSNIVLPQIESIDYSTSTVTFTAPHGIASVPNYYTNSCVAQINDFTIKTNYKAVPSGLQAENTFKIAQIVSPTALRFSRTPDGANYVLPCAEPTFVDFTKWHLQYIPYGTAGVNILFEPCVAVKVVVMVRTQHGQPYFDLRGNETTADNPAEVGTILGLGNAIIERTHWISGNGLITVRTSGTGNTIRSAGLAKVTYDTINTWRFENITLFNRLTYNNNYPTFCNGTRFLIYKLA